MAKEIKGRAEGVIKDLVAFADKIMKEGFKLEFEGFEDGFKVPKVFMTHAITKGH